MKKRPAASRGRRASVLVLTILWLTVGAIAADDRHPLKPADTSSPRATLRSFIESTSAIYDYLSELDWDEHDDDQFDQLLNRIHDCLDMSQEPEFLRDQYANEAAVSLKEVLDRVEIPPYAQIPDADAMAAATTSSWNVPHTGIEIEKMVEGDRAGEYLFSARTVNRAPHFFRLVEELPYRADGPAVSEGFYEWFLSEPGVRWLSVLVHALPEWTNARVGRLAIWQWVGLLVTLILVYGPIILLWRFFKRPRFSGPDAGPLRRSLTLLLPLLVILLSRWAGRFLGDELAITGLVLAILQLVLNLTMLIGMMGLVVGGFNRLADFLLDSPRFNPHGIDAQFTRLILRLLSMVAVVFVFLEGGRYIGISLSTLIAGAGVGGLALALSAQDILKNLFGSMTIFLDKPFRVGERIKTRGYDGVVEQIGLRSTKIRLLNSHVAWIPNDTMATSDVENVARREFIKRSTNLSLPLDLTPEKAQQALEVVRRVLENHEGMDASRPPRVYFNEFNRDSLNVVMMYWYHPADYWKFLQFSETVNLRIAHELAKAGIRFALPATTTFMSQTAERPIEFKVVRETETPPTDGP